ncbi:endonuclease/exonuclease/phosphatase family protein [Saccharospirillum salsuginis]|uniref:Endonuclease/exonuclease/phosphatase domain-containing protein n=1 Tax=Saccharospirillum salsuginis TaxID=418750 RepID=A0A918K5H9_9GAMM|nr:endonuclease/exonuclease/phosphatase family protein [Saccharospirillum salsuginis]GGX47665.1 hypothetical protein GCM10007392_13150 [Saccharospirillum salsuginis]
MVRFGVAVFLLSLMAAVNAAPLRVASFNIHYITPNQTDIVWSERRDAVRRVIGEMNADIIAFQEMETFVGGHFNDENRQLDWVLEHYPEYTAGAIGDPREFPITQPILFRSKRFTLEDQGWFFYSDTPDEIYSRTFNGSYPAFTTWVELTDRTTGETVRIVNNHFDYASGSNRRKSAELVANRLESVLNSGKAVILLGDFNAPGFWPPMGFLKDQGFRLVDPAGSTYHHNRGWHLIPAIDHILVTDDLCALDGIRRYTRDYKGVYPADHYPILAELSWTGKPLAQQCDSRALSG